jgi:hypothetical protein
MTHEPMQPEPDGTPKTALAKRIGLGLVVA